MTAADSTGTADGADRVDVLVVGGGPTGLVIANTLGLHGVRCLLVERNAATVAEPRAVSIDDESLRTMQYLGLADTLRPTLLAGYGSHYFSPNGRCFAKVVPDAVDYGWPRRSAFRQPVLEAQLRGALARHASVEARFSTRVTALEPAADGVVATLTATGADADDPTRHHPATTPPAPRVHARYVVACDGARSGIRAALGIAMGGSTDDQRWLIVDLAGSTDRFRHTRVYCDPERPALALPGPAGRRRYEFRLRPGEQPEQVLDEAHVRRLLARHSAEDATLAIVRKVVYHFHARVAERWSDGRIWLAGDAAHLSPPFAGQGMNSGIRDAHNLAWKLAWCVQGRLGDGALATYEAERKPHATALIRMAVSMGRVMMPKSAFDAWATQTAFRLLGAWRPARDYVMQMKYKPQPHFAHGLLAGRAGVTLRGRMLPQPLVERPDGNRVLLDEVLGHGFALIELDDGVRPLAPAGSGLALGVRRIHLLPRDHRFVDVDDRAGSATATADSAVAAGADADAGSRTAAAADRPRRAAPPTSVGNAAADRPHVVRDSGGTLAALFERAGVRGVVVRPDRYVAAALAHDADAGEAGRLLDALVQASRQTMAAPSMARPGRLLAID